MELGSAAVLLSTTLELGLINSLVVLALFLSYSMLNVCDLSTDGCFTLGAAVGAVVALSGHPYLAVLAAMAAGMASGFVTSLLQTRFGINSLLSGIIVNTALYSVNIAVMGKSSLLNMNKTRTVFTEMKALFSSIIARSGKAINPMNVTSASNIAVALIAVIITVVFLSLFLRTKLGLAIRATGNNPDMVRSSSINPVMTTIVGLVISNSFTALSGCLLAQMQKSVNIDIGSGMVTMALASLLIGGTFLGKGKIPLRAIGAVLGATIFQLVFTIALRLNMPAFMLKLISSVIVMIAIAGPYFKKQFPEMKRRFSHSAGRRKNA